MVLTLEIRDGQLCREARIRCMPRRPERRHSRVGPAARRRNLSRSSPRRQPTGPLCALCHRYRRVATTRSFLVAHSSVSLQPTALSMQTRPPKPAPAVTSNASSYGRLHRTVRLLRRRVVNRSEFCEPDVPVRVSCNRSGLSRPIDLLTNEGLEETGSKSADRPAERGVRAEASLSGAVSQERGSK